MPGSSCRQPSAGSPAASADSLERAAPLEQDHVAPTPGPIASETLLDPDPAEAGRAVDGQARDILDQDARQEGPDAGCLGGLNLGCQQARANPPPLGIGRDVDTHPGHSVIDVAV